MNDCFFFEFPVNSNWVRASHKWEAGVGILMCVEKNSVFETLRLSL